MARVLGAGHGEGDVSGAPRDVQHVVALIDGGLAHHAREPQLVGAGAGEGVEPLVFPGDMREDVAHALAGKLGRGLKPGGGVDGHWCKTPSCGVPIPQDRAFRIVVWPQYRALARKSRAHIPRRRGAVLSWVAN